MRVLLRALLRAGAPWAPLFLVLASCQTWQQHEDYGRWRLYTRPDEEVATQRFEEAFEPAFDAVEDNMGAFERPVRVHAWHGGVELSSGNHGEIRPADDPGLVQQVDGIGPARVRAFHSRGGGAFSPSGIFIGEPDEGTAVHELVHARLAEEEGHLPLWFEEGLATLLADGAMYEGSWTTDGLSCWPLRELSEETLSDAEIARLLELTARDHHSVRENLLVHFLGWAIVFDLAREDPDADWRVWFDRFQRSPAPVAEARLRMERSLARSTSEAWVASGLQHPEAAHRLATVRGLWKIADRQLLRVLMEALEVEDDPQVRLGLAVNLLAGAGSLSLSWGDWSTLRPRILAALDGLEVPDENERSAAAALLDAYELGRSQGRSREAFAQLERYWEE